MESAQSNIQKYVFNIKPLMILRLLCGYYHDVQASRCVRWITKGYCLLVSTSVLFSVTVWFTQISFMVKVLVLSEYLTFLTFTAFTKDNLILKFCQFLPAVDSLQDSKPLLSKFNFFLYFLITLIPVVKMAHMTNICYITNGACFIATSTMVIGNLMATVVQIGRIKPIIIYGLLYCRMRTLRKSLETNGETMFNNLTPNNFINIYQMIVDKFQETNYMNIVILLGTIPTASRFIQALRDGIILYKVENPKALIGAILLNGTLNTAYDFSFFAMIELTAHEINKIRTWTVNKLAFGDISNEKRSQLMLALQVTSRPFQTGIWRVLPFDVQYPFALIYFWIMLVLDLVQATSWFE